jgi:hypothetical protein
MLGLLFGASLLVGLPLLAALRRRAVRRLRGHGA